MQKYLSSICRLYKEKELTKKDLETPFIDVFLLQITAISLDFITIISEENVMNIIRSC